MEFEFRLQGGDFTDAGQASSCVKKYLKESKVDQSIIRRCVVALFEAEINVVAHANHGSIKVKITDNEILMMIEDFGPGIENIDLAMSEGYSTASDAVREMGFGAGMGLPNIKRNADEFEIDSVLGIGVNAKIVIYLK